MCVPYNKNQYYVPEDHGLVNHFSFDRQILHSSIIPHIFTFLSLNGFEPTTSRLIGQLIYRQTTNSFGLVNHFNEQLIT